jgi:RHS repeat-associated protein
VFPQKQLQYDGLGRLTFVCEINSLPGSGGCGQSSAATGFSTTYTYDPLGNLLTVAQNGQAGASGGTQSRTYSYDGLSRLTSESNPETGTTTYAYDSESSCGSSGSTTSNGDLLQKTDASGTSCYYYDGLHRLTNVGNSSQSKTNFCKRFRYDNSANGVISPPPGSTLTYLAGRLVEAETDNCASPTPLLITDEWFAYGSRGKLTDIFESTPGSGGYYHSHIVPLANYVVGSLGLYNSSGTELMPYQTYGVDGEGRLNSVTASSGQNPVTSVNYVTSNGMGEPVGALTGVTFGSADSDSYEYSTTTGRMKQYSLNVNGQSAVGNLQWNLNGTLEQPDISDPFNSGNNQTCTYTYDALSRITGNSCATNVFAQTFSYDAFGNISKSGSLPWQPTYNNPINNQYLTGWNDVSYYPNGDLKTDPDNTYIWDVYGDLASVNGQTVTYDAFGRMVENASGGTQFVYSPAGGPVLAHLNGQNLDSALIPLPGGEVAVYNASQLTQYNHSDWLGSARLFSTPTGTAISAMSYAPFGEGYGGGAQYVQFTPGGNDWTVADNENDTGSLVDFTFRRYSPSQGRWISPDPAGLAAVDPRSPQSWNRYAYVGGSPLTQTDPSGLDYIGGHWFPFSQGGSMQETCFAGSGPCGPDCVIDGVEGSCNTLWNLGSNEFDLLGVVFKFSYLPEGVVTTSSTTALDNTDQNGNVQAAATNLDGYYVAPGMVLVPNSVFQSIAAANNGNCQAPFLCNPGNTATIGPTPQPKQNPPGLKPYLTKYVPCAAGGLVNQFFGDDDTAATTVLINIAPLAPANYLKGGCDLSTRCPFDQNRRS